MGSEPEKSNVYVLGTFSINRCMTRMDILSHSDVTYGAFCIYSFLSSFL